MRTSKLRRATLAGLLSVAVAGTLLAATPNAASASASQCPASYFCVWEHSPFTGRFAYFSIGSDDLRRPIGGFVFDNKITDVWNRTNQLWCLFDGTNYLGPAKRIAAGYKGYTFEFNDRTSSLHYYYAPRFMTC